MYIPHIILFVSFQVSTFRHFDILFMMTAQATVWPKDRFSLTVLLGELWLLFLQLLQVEGFAAVQQLENLLTRGWSTEAKYTIGTFRQIHSDVNCSVTCTCLYSSESSPRFWSDRLFEEVLCGSCQFSVTGWSFQFSLHLTALRCKKI